MGRAFVERFTRDGAADLLIHHRGGEDQAGALARDVQDAGARAHVIAADLAHAEGPRVLVEQVSRALGGRPLDILVLNASAPMVTVPLAEVSDEAFDLMMAVNARASFHLLRGLVPLLAEGGRVIGISTPYVERAEAARGVVAASKAALQAMILSLARELGPRRITANVIMPGPTNTESFNRQVPAAFHADIVRQTPLGRLGEPADVADVAAFLVSQEARWVTGQILKVGGGLI
jgi:3-oxoacyl-[acyl-carrier protein] reductase